MAVKAFKTYLTYYDVARELSPNEQGKYWRAIMAYMFEDVDSEAELPKMARMAFKAVKGNLKRSKSNARGEYIGEESGKNRGEVPQPENALSLSSSLSSKGIGPGSARGNADPIPGPDAADVPCPSCGATVQAVKKGSFYSIMCASCKADVAVPASYIMKAGDAS